MPKIMSFGRGEAPKENKFKFFWEYFNSLDVFFRFTIFTVLLIAIVTPIVISQQHIFTQKAATLASTATINISPSSGSYSIGQVFSVDLVIDGGGQTFNAASATVTVSGPVQIKSLTITPALSGGCNFVFINQVKTPAVNDPSFTGAILNGSSTNCTLYTLTLQATGQGSASITITKPQVKSYINNKEILFSTQNGLYTIATPITPTPTLAPTATPFPTNTPTPVITNTPTPTPVATVTPLPLNAPTIDTIPSDTYENSLTLSGTKSTMITKVFVNNTTINVAYPSPTTWQLPVTLSLGMNTFSVFGKDASENSSTTTTADISLHRLADLNGDSIIDLTDLSMFATDWDNTGTLNYPLSDMDGNGQVDLTDFSIIAKAYGN